MKASLLSTSLMAIIILVNCSGDRAVVDRVNIESDSGQSLNMSEDPGPQYPPQYGHDEFKPPSMILICYNGIPDSIGSFCAIQVCAWLTDSYANPYSNPGIEVNFEVIPDSLATINNTVYTNEWGAALTKLVYPSYYAFKKIQLIASCHLIADTVILTLPVYRPELELNAKRERLWIEQPGAYDTSIVACRLIDGLGNFIGGGRIVFRALVGGEICGPTSVYTDDHGWAYTEYRVGYEEIPDGNSDPNSMETGVKATLFGYPDVEEEISLFCYRP